MAALGWAMQLKYYPLFLTVPPDRWPAWHRRHCAMLGALVPIPLMGECLGAAWMAYQEPANLDVWMGVALAGFGAMWTFLRAGPRHTVLSRGHDVPVIQALIRDNLPRTIAWTLHTGVALMTVFFRTP